MNKKISKIIAGISVLGCLGAFLPSQVNAAKSCRGYTTPAACHRFQGCHWLDLSFCAGPEPECAYQHTPGGCSTAGPGCTWIENGICQGQH